MKNTAKIVTGFIAGTVLGTALGILIAPKKGSKTRVMLADKAKELSDTVSKNYSKTKDMLGLRNKESMEKLS